SESQKVRRSEDLRQPLAHWLTHLLAFYHAHAPFAHVDRKRVVQGFEQFSRARKSESQKVRRSENWRQPLAHWLTHLLAFYHARDARVEAARTRGTRPFEQFSRARKSESQKVRRSENWRQLLAYWLTHLLAFYHAHAPFTH